MRCFRLFACLILLAPAAAFAQHGGGGHGGGGRGGGGRGHFCSGAPTVTLSVSPAVIWPPNHKLVPVTLSGTISQGGGCSLSSAGYALADEYGANQSGAVAVDAGGNFSATVLVEASRRGDDPDGRTYTFTVSAANQAGIGSSAPATTVVPHDRRP